MEPRDPVGSVRPKAVALEGGRGSNEEDQEVAGLDLAQGDDVIDHVLRQRWGVSGEGEGLEEQGEGLEEQEFSIKEASFQEGSLKLKIQTTKRTKKPPKSLENYICPPEIRMTGERGARGGRGCCRGGAQEEERGPPRKRTYERQFKAAEQREGGLLQLLGDHPPPKLPLTQPHLHTPTWDLLSTGTANEDTESAREQASTNRSPLVEPIQPYSLQRGPDESPFPERSLTPDPQLPVVTDASILNLTSLSRGRGLQEVSEQLFGNIKRKYGRKDSQRTLGNTHNAEVWGKQTEVGGEGLQPEERQRSRREETPHLLPEEREERSSAGRRGEEDDREMPMLTEEGKGKKRRRRSFQESYSLEDQSALPQDSDITEIGHPGPSEPKVAPKMAANKRDSGLGKRVEVESERAGKGEKSERSERGERERAEPGVSQSRVRSNLIGRSRTSTEPNPNPTLLSPNPIASPSPRSRPNLSPSPRPRPNLNPSPRPRPNLSPSPRPRPNLSPSPSPRPNLSPSPRPRPNVSPNPRPRSNLSPSPRPNHSPSPSPSPRPRPNHSPCPNPNPSPCPNPRARPNLSPNPSSRPNLSPSPRPRPNLSPSPRARPNLSPSPRFNHSPNPSPRPNLSPSPSPRSHPHSIPISMPSPTPSPSPRPAKTKDRWSYLKAKSPPSLSPRDMGAPSDPPSAFPITPSSPLYTNTDSLTVHAPPKRKRGRPKKQPLLTVETIHEGTSPCPPSPPASPFSGGMGRGRKSHALASLAQISSPGAANANGLRLPRGRGGRPRPVSRLKLGKVQSILNEILSGSAHDGSLALMKSSPSAPVTSAMTAVASSIEARLGKQINVSKRGTIYIGKKRGRKPRAQTQADAPRAGLYDGHLVPSAPLPPPPPPHGSAHSLRPGLYEAAMPSLQPVSALPSKLAGRGASLHAGGWKLSPPRLLAANSPSHLSEGASAKEVTLSPISESHSEETIPSDSGIGTDNNSTSDQTEKGPASRRRYSFDLCGLDAAEAAVLEASSRGRCERQVAAVDSFLSQQDKKQKHHRRKRKCLQSRDHLHFLSELEEVVLKLQQLRVSHRRSSCYAQQPYPSIFRLNFHHYYPLAFHHPYACDSAPYLRRSAQLKAKRRRGRPAKTSSQPIPTAKLPLVGGYGYPLAGGNYYASPYAMPYPPPLSLGYYPPAPPLYLPPHPLGHPAPPSPFMRPAGPPPKAFHSGGHAQTGAKLRASSGPLQGLSGRGAEGRGPPLGGLGGGGEGGLGGVRLHKRKHKHKHKHKDDALLSARDRQELGGLFSGSLLSDRRELTGQGGGGGEKGRGQRAALSSLSLADAHFHSRQPAQPIGGGGFLGGYRGQSQRASQELLFSESRDEAGGGRSRRRGLPVFGEEGMMSFHNARTEESLVSDCPSITGKRRYKRREVEEIQKEVRRNFDHVQKILRVKRLQRQAKTGNNVVKRRPGRPRKRPLEEPELTNHRADDRVERRGEGRSLGMPVLERCVDLPGRRSLRPGPAPQPLEFSNHDSISAAIETVVHRARSLAPAQARGAKRRGRRREELWTPNNQ